MSLQTIRSNYIKKINYRYFRQSLNTAYDRVITCAHRCFDKMPCLASHFTHRQLQFRNHLVTQSHHGWGLQSLTFISQVAPSKPSWHRQVKLSPLLTQVPWLPQGLLSHAWTDATQQTGDSKREILCLRLFLSLSSSFLSRHLLTMYMHLFISPCAECTTAWKGYVSMTYTYRTTGYFAHWSCKRTENYNLRNWQEFPSHPWGHLQE